jgi:predicted helicase
LLLRGSDQEHQKAFEQFVKGLRKNLNPSVTEEDAIEMLAQHLITKPVFDALFEGYEFAKNNPVSKSFKKMIDLLEDQTFERDQKKLDEFYDSVRRKVGGIDNAAAKQTIIKELYDKFFNLAFPRMAERLGIVYTPIEVVDFIIKSAEVALNQEFNLSLTDRNVHILDPFTGTGTFVVRLLQSGIIKPEDLEYKYINNLHANEIVLLAYYIAAINIEETFHDLNEAHKYVPFDGIVLADTFQMNEGKTEFEERMFPENNKRVKKQMESPIQVIIGNPPYSAQQGSENDGNKNVKYEYLDERIRQTYAKESNAGLLKNLYDSYIRAIRWATDRINVKGIVCFVTNGSFIDSNNMDGLRACLYKECSSAYIFNLRGNARTQGEQRRKEKGNIFGEGTRTPIAISIIVKNPAANEQGKIYYHDIGDYLSREQKLKIISDFGSIDGIDWEEITPNESNDWINHRSPQFDKFIALGDKDGLEPLSVFDNYSLGIITNRDAWTYNFSKKSLLGNMKRMIDFYQEQLADFKKHQSGMSFKNVAERQSLVESFINNDSLKISWTRSLKNSIGRGAQFELKPNNTIVGMYRPYSKCWLYYDKNFNEMPNQMPKIFPESGIDNLIICVTGRGATKEFSVLMSRNLPDMEMISKAQCFPLYTYELNDSPPDLFSTESANSPASKYVRRDNINDKIVKKFTETYKSEISKEDIFYYIYGVLHSKDFQIRFEFDLKKIQTRIPLAKDFWAFSRAGRDLASWHLNYETIEPFALMLDGEIVLGDPKLYEVTKMYFPKIGGKEDRSTIVYNNLIKLGGIPLEAYDYVVNGKSAIEWVMDRYQASIDKDSQIKNDPNEWCREERDPEYIINLIKRVVMVSVESVKIINSLPKLEELT